MKCMKRFIAGMLCASMLLNMNGIVSFAATNDMTDSDTAMETQTTETTTEEEQGNEDLTEDSVVEETTSQAENSADISEDIIEETALVIEEDADVTEENAPLINWLVVAEDYITSSMEQNILVDVGDENTNITAASISYRHCASGTEYEQDMTSKDGTLLTFRLAAETIKESGEYEITKMSVEADGVRYEIDFAKIGIEARFGVEVMVDTNADVLLTSEDDTPLDMDGVVVTDAQGNEISSSDIGEAISDMNAGRKAKRSSSGAVVVVLDPGHGGSDGGASGNGVLEKNVNLKIAQYCKAQLETYQGVIVYMTRNSDVYVGLDERVDYAASVNADLFVSLHNNSASGGATGTEVYYPNANYNPNVSNQGAAVSQAILNALTGLGLSDRGIRIRDYSPAGGASTTDYYPDGSVSDYYAVIRGSKLRGFPGIIVEHAFISNPSDVANYLTSESSLKALGMADANAIASYFGLRQGNPTVYHGVDYSAVYDYDYYLSRYPSLKKIYGNDPYGALRHFVAYGMKERRQAIADFNVVYYMNRYVGLRNTYGKDYKQYYMHYIKYGKTEGRDGKTSCNRIGKVTKYNGVDYSAVYDFDYYQKKYSGIKATYGDDDVETLAHFVKYGMKEGRQAISTFNVAAYACRYYGLRKTYKNNLQQYYMHYIKYGKNEGRRATGNTTIMQGGPTVYQGLDYSAVFNVGYYANKYSNMRKQYGFDDSKYLAHFVKYGMTEGRQASAEFNVTYYKNRYPSLRNVYGNDLKKYYLHYIKYGRAEGRDGKTYTARIGCVTVYEGVDYKDVYDFDYYQKKYNGIKKTYGNDEVKTLAHFVKYGMKEGRQAKANFDVTSYRYANPGLRKVYRNNLKKYFEHYMKYGKNENRTTTGVTTLQNPWTVYNGVDYSSQYNFWEFRESHPSLAERFGMDDYGLLEYYVTTFVGKTPIAGKSTTTVSQMVRYYNAKATYPSYYRSSDAPNIQTFCQIVYDESVAEGIDPAVTFCQAMKETGFLRFGGDVSITQYNFAGLGATGGVPGLSFSSVRQGIRAQVQHLKAYANNVPLNNPCVDTRFSYVTRGTAPFVEWLGIHENPYGRGWASAVNYGYSLKNDYICVLYRY